jgi:hypothetical protein
MHKTDNMIQWTCTTGATPSQQTLTTSPATAVHTKTGAPVWVVGQAQETNHLIIIPDSEDNNCLEPTTVDGSEYSATVCFDIDSSPPPHVTEAVKKLEFESPKKNYLEDNGEDEELELSSSDILAAMLKYIQHQTSTNDVISFESVVDHIELLGAEPGRHFERDWLSTEFNNAVAELSSSQCDMGISDDHDSEATQSACGTILSDITGDRGAQPSEVASDLEVRASVLACVV